MGNRDNVNAADMWRITDIFADDAAWEKAFIRAQALVAAYPAHEGKLADGADALFAALADESAISLAVEKLYAYAHLRRDEDNGVALYQGMTDRAMQLYVLAGGNSAFVTPEILAIPETTLADWTREDRFIPFRFAIENIERMRPHTLDSAGERLLALSEEPLSGADTIFTMLSDVDMTFGTVTESDGTVTKLTHGTYGRLLQSPDRRVRRDAYEGMYRAYRAMGNTIAATYTTSVKSDVFRATARNYDGALDEALFAHNVPVAVYDQLIEAVHERLPALKKYLKLRKEKLGIAQLEMYDLYVPIVPDCDTPLPYEEAKSLVREALRPLGDAYQTLLDSAYRDGWIDVYENPGKTSGAFSSGVYGVHPYVLLNYENRLEDAFTLAHELGHAMHSFHSDAAQPYETSQYSIMVAEVASTVNETLLTRHLLATEKDKMRRAYCLNHFLEQFRTTCYRQTMFAEFERESHAMAERGEPLTVESLSDMYRKLNELYYPGVHVDDNIAAEWMRIPHFYNAFYVYQYATGLCSAVKLADDVLHHDGLSRYIEFLSSGGSAYPVEQLRRAGVDLTDKRSILASLDEFERCVDELTELLHE